MSKVRFNHYGKAGPDELFYTMKAESGDYYPAADYEALEAEVKLLDNRRLELCKTSANKSYKIANLEAESASLRARNAELEAEVARLNAHAVEVYKEQRKDYLALEAKLAALVEAAQEVVRISNRKHDAWDKLKAAIEAATKGRE